MPRIAILSASVRQGRNSHRVALHLQRVLNGSADVDLLDLAAYDFPLFEERLKFQQDPAPRTVEFAQRFAQADGVIIVTPEYNGGYPASLKNVLDLLVDEWKRKPVALCTVSNGPFGGMQVATSLVLSLWKIKAWVVSAHLPVPKVSEAFNEAGEPTDPEAWAKRTKAFVDELLWAIEAERRMA
ncbi:MAG: NAD(P)H-dependent oxidoreductase [Flavobacteriales bacterium]|nr:NAD(P)H-dependent oxidoreductase [Flavobacteriales bacterium]